MVEAFDQKQTRPLDFFKAGVSFPHLLCEITEPTLLSLSIIFEKDVYSKIPNPVIFDEIILNWLKQQASLMVLFMFQENALKLR